MDVIWQSACYFSVNGSAIDQKEGGALVGSENHNMKNLCIHMVFHVQAVFPDNTLALPASDPPALTLIDKQDSAVVRITMS